jgi:hypothetical protein
MNHVNSINSNAALIKFSEGLLRKNGVNCYPISKNLATCLAERSNWRIGWLIFSLAMVAFAVWLFIGTASFKGGQRSEYFAVTFSISVIAWVILSGAVTLFYKTTKPGDKVMKMASDFSDLYTKLYQVARPFLVQLYRMPIPNDLVSEGSPVENMLGIFVAAMHQALREEAREVAKLQDEGYITQAESRRTRWVKMRDFLRDEIGLKPLETHEYFPVLEPAKY